MNATITPEMHPDVSRIVNPEVRPISNPDLFEQFERDGFIVIPNALSPAEVEYYIAVIDRLDAECRAERSLGPDETLEIRNSVARAPELLGLLSNPKTLPIVMDALGWNIQLSTSHVYVRTPNKRDGTNTKPLDYHWDGPHPGFPVVHGTIPLMYGKVGFYLTDLSQPDMGNLRVVPGSHLKAGVPPMDEKGEPVGAIEVLTRPGDAVFFQQRTWHAVSPNYAAHTRKNVYIGYCPRWLKPIDFFTQSEELMAQATPVQQQLLGKATDPISNYLPHRYPDDVPLRNA